MSLKFFIIFLLNIHVIFCVNIPFFLYSKMCLGKECHRLESSIKNSLNYSRSPCNNFYKYTCDNWRSDNVKPESEPIWNQYISLNYKINNQIQHILENKDNNLQAHIFYESCISQEYENKYLNEFRVYINKLGGWPIFGEFKQKHYNCLHQIAGVTRLLKIHPILKFFVDVDLSDTSKYSLYIGHGDTNFPNLFLIEPNKYFEEINLYKNWIVNIIKTIYNDTTRMDFEENVMKMIQFEIDLVKVSTQKDKNKHMTIKQMTKETKINWIGIMKILFEGSNVNVDNIERVIVKPNYLQHLLKLLAKTDSRIISSYIMWSVVKEISRHVNSDLRNAYFMVDLAILGVNKDIDRKYECVQNVLKYFSVELVPKYSELYFDNTTISKVANMSNNIRKEFVKTLQNNFWMSEYTKQIVVDKIKHLKFDIGYPTYDMNFSQVQLSSNYLLNIIKLRNGDSRNNLEYLDLEVTHVKWPTHIFDVNAYYSVLQNSIILPLGLLGPPFFDAYRPNVLNYGALGSLIGHEISHALDTTGYMANKHGVIGKWWLINDIENFHKKVDCFRKQYDKYGIDGVYTLGENIADNVGLKLSYAAMQKYIVSSKAVPNIPEFTYTKLFFIGYGQLWCEITNEKDILLEEEHAPVELRVLGSLFNFDEFKHSFKCREKKGKQKEMCNLW